MAFEIKDNSGSLFPNDRKATDKHPDYSGQARIDGVDYWISGWRKEGKSGGKKFLSFSFKRKEDRREDLERQADRNVAPAADDSDLPF